MNIIGTDEEPNPVSTAKRESNRRNPLNWSMPDTRTSRLTDRGYTGHACAPQCQCRRKHLDEAHIINMPVRRSLGEGGNGREPVPKSEATSGYDPIVGRMPARLSRSAGGLSPDPVLQNPYSTQNYNRYSYVVNNPLKYTDPTGYSMLHRILEEEIHGGNGLPSWYAGDDFFGGWMPYQESMQYVIDQQNAGNSWVSDGNGGGVWASSDEYITGNAAIGEAMDMGVDIVSNNKGITIHGMMPNGSVTGDIYGTWENGATFLYSKGSAANSEDDELHSGFFLDIGGDISLGVQIMGELANIELTARAIAVSLISGSVNNQIGGKGYIIGKEGVNITNQFGVGAGILSLNYGQYFNQQNYNTTDLTRILNIGFLFIGQAEFKWNGNGFIDGFESFYIGGNVNPKFGFILGVEGWINAGYLYKNH